MNREQKIEAIYEKIADKTLSFGCKISHSGGEEIIIGDKGQILSLGGSICGGEDYVEDEIYYLSDIQRYEEVKIIGHRIMIGNILHYILGKGNLLVLENKDRILKIIKIWFDKRKPLEDQSSECIDYIYNILELGK